MSTSSDWLRHNHEALHYQAFKTREYLSDPANRARMGFGADTPQGQWFDTTFAAAFTAFDAAYTRWKDEPTRTATVRLEFETAEKAFKKVYRHLYMGFLKLNPLVTDTDLVDMLLPIRRSIRHRRHHVPDKTVDAHVILRGLASFDIHFRDAEQMNKAKPPGVKGVEMHSKISDAPLWSLSELTDSQFITSSPFRMTFPDKYRGKTFSFSLRWQGVRGEQGPPGQIFHAIIP
jgi:hypothetical protein